MNRNFKLRFAVACVILVVQLRASADGDASACDVTHGERVFQKCAVCHSIDPDAAHGAGPNLHGTAGRPVGKIDGFKFSKSMRESERNWTDEHLHDFLENPASTYKRNRMAFGGLKNTEDRAAVVCYLKLQQ